jgi:hypothetical protein
MNTLTEVLKLVPFDAPAGTVVDSIVVTATDAAGNHVGSTITALTPDANGNLMAPPITLEVGVWTVSAQAFSGTTPVGPAAVDPTPYTVAAPTTVSVQIPGAATGTVA